MGHKVRKRQGISFWIWCGNLGKEMLKCVVRSQTSVDSVLLCGVMLLCKEMVQQPNQFHYRRYGVCNVTVCMPDNFVGNIYEQHFCGQLIFMRLEFKQELYFFILAWRNRKEICWFIREKMDIGYQITEKGKK